MKTAKTGVLVIGTLTAVMIAATIAARLPGQGGGSRAGVQPAATFAGQPVAPPSASPDHEAVESNIEIVGTAEIRVKPTAVRVIMALTSQGATAEECMKANEKKEQALTQAWSKMGVPDDKVFLDFISMLPVYEWNVQQQEGNRYLVEDLSGYLVQTNAHIQVANEAEARAAVRAAFQLGMTDIISFDYWCESLDNYKVQAQKQALANAQRKAELLLTAHFRNAQTPKPLNIREQTQVIYPKSLYESFTNDYSQSLHRTYHRQSLPEIRAFRPKNTHYRGFFGHTDSQDPRLPMQPEISVVSTISCYYAAPGEKKDRAAK